MIASTSALTSSSNDSRIDSPAEMSRSTTTCRIGRPAMPPRALISAIASAEPLRISWPSALPSPCSGKAEPMMNGRLARRTCAAVTGCGAGARSGAGCSESPPSASAWPGSGRRISPRRTDIAASAARFASSVLRSRCSTCVPIVRLEVTSAAAISWLVSPPASSVSTSISRAVRP